MQDLTRERVQMLLKTSRYGRSLELKDSTGSTNDDARQAARAGAPDGHVVVADTQSAGRGSRGRPWVSPAGTDLYVSTVARVPLEVAQLPPLTLAVGLAVADTIDGFLPSYVRALVKWPNDVWVSSCKCAGILVEGASLGDRMEPLVIGIGINVNRTQFPEGLDTQPTSIALSRGESVDRAAVLSTLLTNLEAWIERFVAHGPEPVAQALDARLALRGEYAQVDEWVGVVEGVSHAGALKLRTDSGLKEVVSGTLRPCVPPPRVPG